MHSGSDAMRTLMGTLGDVMAGAPELVMLSPAVGKGLDKVVRGLRPTSTEFSLRTGMLLRPTAARSTLLGQAATLAPAVVPSSARRSKRRGCRH